jgi:hypothetical protein
MDPTSCVVSSTASRISCSDDGSELLTRSIRWLTPSTYQICQVCLLQPAPKVQKIRFNSSATEAATSEYFSNSSFGTGAPSRRLWAPQISRISGLISITFMAGSAPINRAGLPASTSRPNGGSVGFFGPLSVRSRSMEQRHRPVACRHDSGPCENYRGLMHETVVIIDDRTRFKQDFPGNFGVARLFGPLEL